MRYRIKTYRTEFVIGENPPTTIGSPDAAVAFAREIYKELDAEREHFTVLVVDGRNRVTGFKVLFSGAHNRTTIGIPETLRAVLLLGGMSFVIVHNHPGGSLIASQDDMTVVGQIAAAVKVVGLTVIDSIILTETEHFSFREHQMMPV